jgi:hypothetical protein
MSDTNRPILGNRGKLLVFAGLVFDALVVATCFIGPMPELPAIRTGAQGFFPSLRAHNPRPPNPQFYRFVVLPAAFAWT